jgi:uncharacterized membrane protein
MSDLIVVAFDHLEDARKAMRHLRELEGLGQIELEDTAILEIDQDGKAHVRNELAGATETGAAIGAFIGGLASFLFPVVGIVVGAAAGAAIGAALKTGVDQDFIEDVKRELTPGRSALFLVVRKASIDAVIAALRPFKGTVIQTTLPTDAEDELRRALAV